MNKYNMQCDITLIYSNMISLISSIFPANIADKRLFKVFHKYNLPTLIYKKYSIVIFNIQMK